MAVHALRTPVEALGFVTHKIVQWHKQNGKRFRHFHAAITPDNELAIACDACPTKGDGSNRFFGWGDRHGGGKRLHDFSYFVVHHLKTATHLRRWAAKTDKVVIQLPPPASDIKGGRLPEPVVVMRGQQHAPIAELATKNPRQDYVDRFTFSKDRWKCNTCGYSGAMTYKVNK